MQTINDDWRYWLIVYIGSEEEPQIIHMAGYKDPIKEHNVANLMHQVMHHPQFGINEEYWGQLKIGELPDDEARQIISMNASQMDTLVEETSAVIGEKE